MTRFYWSAILDHDPELSVGARLTYVTLATYIDADGSCRPSVRTLAKRMHRDPKSVVRWLDELEAANAIRRVPGAQAKVTTYHLLVWAPTTVIRQESPGQMALPGVLASGQQGVGVMPTQVLASCQQGVGVMPTKQHQEQHQLNNTTEHTPPTPRKSLDRVTPEVLPAVAPHGAVQRDLSVSDDERFRIFWRDYPRKIARAEAAKSFARSVKRDGADVIAAGLAAWTRSWQADGTEERYIPHPTTWLNQSRYLDTPPAPRPVEPKGFAGLRAYLDDTEGDC
jgi:hypothetical protein